MRALQSARTCLVLGALILASYPAHLPAAGTAHAADTEAREPGSGRDGQHDFDFEFGSWRAHIRRQLHPLAGSDSWVELEGSSVVHKLWDGRANLGELEIGGARSPPRRCTTRSSNHPPRQRGTQLRRT